jgi:hypothetical protein
MVAVPSLVAVSAVPRGDASRWKGIAEDEDRHDRHQLEIAPVAPLTISRRRLRRA